MNKYLITYDLKSPSSLPEYQALHKEIKSISGSWWHYLESTWIIKNTPMKAREISDKLTSHLKSGDRLLVVKIDVSDKQGLLPPDAWKWLNS